MAFQVGDFVINQKAPGWGRGKILEKLGNNYRIFFEDEGEKTVSPVAKLEKIEFEDANPILEHANAETDFSKYRNPKDLETNFLELFPGGFEDPEYLDEERNYKVEASTFAKEVLSEKRIISLLEQKNFEGISKLVKKVINKTKLVFPNEILSFSDGLSAKPENEKIFSEAFFYHLYSKDSLKKRFMAFVKALNQLDAAKWTTATYFLHLIYPVDSPFMKPGVTKKAADAFGYPLDYTTNIKWDTYSRLIEFAKLIGKRISANPLLKPRDMIDIQGFMWCADPSKYTKKSRLNLERKRKERLGKTG